MTFHWEVFWAALVGPFLLPLSMLWDLIFYCRLRLKLLMESGKRTHEEGVRKIQEQVRAWKQEGRGRRMCTARPQWMSVTPTPCRYKDRMYRVSIDLDHILEVDTVNKVVKVEPGVTIGMLNRTLVAKGFTLPIVPELDELTIGGLVTMGGGIESTSHKYGLWHSTCTEYEMVTADASLITANKDINTDVYEALPLSYGTLGFLTAVTMRIIPYKPYIRLEYKPTRTLNEITKTFERETTKSKGNDSVEGIMFSMDEAVIMTGTFVEEEEVEPHLINRLGLWYKPWFYLHVKTALTTGSRVEYIPTLDFHQRHNKPCFWLAHIWLPYGHIFLFRLFFGWMLPVNYQFLKAINISVICPSEDREDDPFVIQDFLVPLPKLQKMLEFYWETLEIMPVWLVPAWVGIDLPDHMPEKQVMYVDVGLYGFVGKKEFNNNKALRECEKVALQEGALQGLYAESLMTKEEFLEMFKLQVVKHEQVRERLPLCKEAFPEVYDKICKAGRKGRGNSGEINDNQKNK